MEDYLKTLYYDAKNPAGFSSQQKLYEAAKEKYPEIRLGFVKDWLSKQLTYNLHKPVRRNFKRNRILVGGIDDQWEADIVEMQDYSRQNKGFRYILTVIDVFSKYAFASCLKTKTAADVCKALEKIFKMRRPIKFRTDRGKEFLNSRVKNLLDGYHILHYITNDDKVKCAVVERFNRTLKSKIYKYMTSTGRRTYYDKLENFIISYNNSSHRSISMPPAKVVKDNARQVFFTLYGAESKRQYLKKNLEKVAYKSISVGDKVRLVYEERAFEKGYHPNWADSIHTVHSISRAREQTTYKLKDERGDLLNRSFYRYEIQKIGDEIFRIEKIIKRRVRAGQIEYFVKWLNHPSTYNSWVNKNAVGTIA